MFCRFPEAGWPFNGGRGRLMICKPPILALLHNPLHNRPESQVKPDPASYRGEPLREGAKWPYIVVFPSLSVILDRNPRLPNSAGKRRFHR